MNTAIVKGIKNCSRCGGDHDELIAKRFVRPIVVGDGEEYTHWVTCPTNGDPILVQMQVDERRSLNPYKDEQADGGN